MRYAHVRLAGLVVAIALASVLGVAPSAQSPSQGLTSRDLYELQSVSDVHVSPDGARVTYSTVHRDRPGTPYSQVWIMDLATGTSTRLGSDDQPASNPRWSPDGQRIAYIGRDDEGSRDHHGALPARGTWYSRDHTSRGRHRPEPRVVCAPLRAGPPHAALMRRRTPATSSARILLPRISMSIRVICNPSRR